MADRTGACADVVIVNWNAGVLLGQAVASIAEHPGGVARIIVVDNGSVDGSADLAPLPLLDVVHVGRNLGFSAGCNFGAARGDAPYILFFNPDARFTEDALEQAIAYLEDPAHRRVGICGIRLVGDDGEIQRHCNNLPTLRGFVGDITGLSRIAPGVFPPLFMTNFDHESDRAVDVVMGAYFLIRRSLFQTLGGFDDRFFVYLDEVDLSKRAIDAGHEVRYLAGPSAYHLGRGTSDQVKAHRLFYQMRSRIHYAFKHLGTGRAAALTATLLTAGPIARLAHAAGRRSWTDARHTLNGYAMLLRNLPSIARDVRARRR